MKKECGEMNENSKGSPIYQNNPKPRKGAKERKISKRNAFHFCVFLCYFCSYLQSVGLKSVSQLLLLATKRSAENAKRTKTDWHFCVFCASLRLLAKSNLFTSQESRYVQVFAAWLFRQIRFRLHRVRSASRAGHWNTGNSRRSGALLPILRRGLSGARGVASRGAFRRPETCR